MARNYTRTGRHLSRLEVMKRDIKRDGEAKYPYLELTLEECYRLYDRSHIIVQASTCEMCYCFSDRTYQKDCILVKKEEV